MVNDQYYEKVAGDDAGEPLVGEGRSSSRVTRAPPTTRKRSKLTKIAFGAVAVTVFLAAVGFVSSAIVSYRLPDALGTALADQEAQGLSRPATTGSSQGAGMGMDMGDGDDADVERIGEAHHDAEVVSEASFVAPFQGAAHQSLKTCGHTADEARAAGCVFDVMMQLWTPPECMDEVLSERFLAKGNWTWYADKEATRAYTDEEIRKGEHDVVYVAQSYHRHHCIFAWQRLTRAIRNKAPLIEELISYDHVMHCRHKTLALTDESVQQVRGVRAPTGFTKCASYDVWIQGLPANKISSID